VAALHDLDAVASPRAWGGVEQYLRLQVRDRLLAVVNSLSLEGAQLDQAVTGGLATDEGRIRLLRLRSRYLQVETVLDFYGDAVNTRTNPELAALLRGFDVLAGDSLDQLLRPIGIDAPPVLVYLDKGLGASILRSGVRLWDEANPSPAAAIKLTRHNLSHPTALFHETGHQFAHLAGWTRELADVLGSVLAPRSRELAELWHSWASEVAADVHAFVLCGWAPVPALANVVDGPTAAVYRIRPGDPHPPALIRVLFNAALCRSWFGAGPWDDLARTWAGRHPASSAGRDGGQVARLSASAFGDIVDVCTRRRMAAFRGRALHELADPRRAAPAALAALAQRAGSSLLTSTYLARRDPVRILAWLSTRMLEDPGRALHHRQVLHRWVSRLGGLVSPDSVATAA
jgi:hypothetical protein